MPPRMSTITRRASAPGENIVLRFTLDDAGVGTSCIVRAWPAIAARTEVGLSEVVNVQTGDHSPEPASLAPRARHHQRRPGSSVIVALLSNAARERTSLR